VLDAVGGAFCAIRGLDAMAQVNIRMAVECFMTRHFILSRAG
jgi:hypothetical protein